ncbi:trichohyalin-like [Leptopilina heterotoma]|uniref:trichohyalin-like n=1 Tax=Leptopilina heterotoma TaxID=63436 RepID=UPI001CA861D4|nr:trichohyalin-like [Leptopilina heterotoma]
MQPGVTVALATVWLAGAVGVFSATLYPSHPSLDQYSPQQSPKHHEVTQETQGHANSKLQDPKDLLTSKHNQTSNVRQPIEMSNLKPPRGTFLRGSQDRSYGIGPEQVDLNLSIKDGIQDEIQFKDVAARNSKKSFNRKEFTRQKDLLIAQQQQQQQQKKKSVSEEDYSDDYDSFQDEGPGSIEVYKLDLFEEGSLFDGNLSKKKEEDASNKLRENEEQENNENNEKNVNEKRKSSFNKSLYEPKKNIMKENQSQIISQIPFLRNLKTRIESGILTPELRFTNKLEDHSENESFGIGGVPELQVGCEGVEASLRDKRFSSASKKDSSHDEAPSHYPENIVNVQLVYESDEDEDPQGVFYEERDELIKLKKLEQELQNPPPHRGDIPVHLYEEYDKKEKLPVRGDLASAFLDADWDIMAQGYKDSKDDTHARKLLSISKLTAPLRRKRDLNREEMWGYGEDEGVMPYENEDRRREKELQREEEERRREDQRKRDEERRREDERRRSDYLRYRQEEERRRSQHHNHHVPEANRRERNETFRGGENDRGDEDRRRHDERRRMEEEFRRTTSHRRNWPSNEKGQNENRRRVNSSSEEERRNLDARRRSDENRRLEEQRRAQEQRRRPQEDRRQDERNRHQSPRRQDERRRYEEQRHREEAERRRNQNENLSPSNLMRPDRRHQQENEKKLRTYISTNTPIVLGVERPSDDSRGPFELRRQNQDPPRSRHFYDSRHQGRDREPIWMEQKRPKESTRPFSANGMKHPENRRNHGPSPPNDMGQRDEMEEMRRERERKEEERRRADRRRIEQEERRLEEEDRRRKSQRYEEERLWHEKMRSQGERMRQEWMHEANRRSQAERRPPWIRPYQFPPSNEKGYQYPPPDANNKGYQPPPPPTFNNKGYQPPPDLNNKGYQPPPSPPDLNQKGYQPPPDLNNKGYQPPPDLNNKGYQPQRINPEYERDRQRLEEERRRNDVERQNREHDSRYQELRRRQDSVRSMDEYRRRQEEESLNSLPVSATIIIRPGGSGTNSSSPVLFSRGGFGSEIDFPGINPNHRGIQAARFPAPATRRPPVKGPGPCIWAVIHCCPRSGQAASCFETLGCPGINWDHNHCNPTIIEAARKEVAKFYNTN